jgi:dephospho-CoA kinase
MIIIGITGTLGAGKGTIVEYLKEKYGFAHYSARDFIVEEVVRRNLEVNRDTITETANSLRGAHHPAYILEELFREASQLGQNSVIESVRTAGEIEMLKSKSNFRLLSVDADPELRYKRIINRKSVTDNITYEKFREDEFREMQSEDPNKQNLKYCMSHSDFIFENNGSLEDLQKQVDEVVSKLLQNEN